MRVSRAIDIANWMRPNTLPREDLKNWLWELDIEIAEMMGQDAPEWDELDDPELLIPDPKSNVYPLYLLPHIDHIQEETDLYQIDMIEANRALADVKAWWRRNNTGNADTKIKGVWI
jgi:hypothetical protein